MAPSGKTLSLISRLPAFYQADEVDRLFIQLLHVFGQAIERSEIDLLQVMRSHHVGTATNEGSQGFYTNQQGDLDRIFALYLEALGGTSLLTQVDPQFRPGSFKDLPGLLQQLQRESDPLSRSIKRGFSASHRTLLENLTFPLSEPQYQEWESILVEELNRCLEDRLFYSRNRSAFVVHDLSSVTRRLIQQTSLQGQDLAILNRALLESAYPNEIETSDAPYRDRLLALIRVLRRGGATKQGIRDIVAANLGIFADNPAAQAAKAQIQIEEYLPELISTSCSIHPFSPNTDPPDQFPLLYFETFAIANPNVLPTMPGFKLEIRDARKQPDQTLPPLINPRFVNLDTQDVFELEVMLEVNDVLRVQPDGTLFLNGVEMSTKSPPPPLPPDTSQWRIEAKVGEPEGRFDETLFDLSRYDQAQSEPVFLSRQQAVNYEIALTIELTKITPGAFRVRIPWDIPGFTDRFSDRQDHPRTQILAIINKVKAAGVMAEIVYESSWTEPHTMEDRLPGFDQEDSL
jgi:hypothetical protein